MDRRMKQRFDWLPAQMPRVAELMKTRRAQDGDAHVNECWRRGVILQEPGWFFAREGALAVGIPDPAWLKDPIMEVAAAYKTSCMLWMKRKEVSNDAAN